MTTLADLRRAIMACANHQFADYEYMELKAEAWRTAFEWRESWRIRSHEITPNSIQWSVYCDEGNKGMRLIREHLK
jgi:hypothetical protein